MTITLSESSEVKGLSGLAGYCAATMFSASENTLKPTEFLALTLN